jgi:3-oxoacyl-[acyl-carrier protein] reductase
VTRVAVVSGGGTGIGKAIAARLAAGGGQVVIIGRRPEVLAAAAQELTAAGPGRVSWCAADLTRPQDVERAAAGVDGTVDVVVDNAGGVASRGMPDGRLAEVARAWEADYQANVISAVLLTQALLSRLRRPGGRVVNISSIAALRAGAVLTPQPRRHCWAGPSTWPPTSARRGSP